MGNVDRTLLQSPRLAAAAAELGGLTGGDPLRPGGAPLPFWPVGDVAAEETLERRFVAPMVAPKSHLTYIVGICS
jgi:hypothetical protein